MNKTKANTRKTPNTDLKYSLLHESGYRCAVPTCREIITYDMHHLVPISGGGKDTTENMIILCPTCHALHHRGTIPLSSLKSWKRFLTALNNSFDSKIVDVLLAMPKLQILELSDDSLIHYCGLINSGYLEIAKRNQSVGWAVSSGPRITLMLSEKGRQFIENWNAGVSA